MTFWNSLDTLNGIKSAIAVALVVLTVIGLVVDRRAAKLQSALDQKNAALIAEADPKKQAMSAVSAIGVFKLAGTGTNFNSAAFLPNSEIIIETEPAIRMFFVQETPQGAEFIAETVLASGQQRWVGKPAGLIDDVKSIEVLLPALSKTDAELTGGSIEVTVNSRIVRRFDLAPQKLTAGKAVIAASKP